MNQQKIVIIVLVLIVVIFFVCVGTGSLMTDDSDKMKSDKKKTGEYDPPNWSKTINKIFGGLQEPVELCKDRAADTKIKCELPAGNIEIKPAKEPWLPFFNKSSFRTVKLVLISGQAEITYNNIKKDSNIENPNQSPLPNFKNADPNVESLVITESGGTLTISCKGNAPCRVGQE